METTSEKNNSKIIIIILSIILAALSIFTLFYMKNSGDKINELSNTKFEIQKSLDEKIMELEKAKTNNEEINAQLDAAKSNLISLRDSIMKLKSIDSKTYKKLNSRISDLEKVKQKLLKDIDSLKSANKILSIEIENANTNIKNQAETIQQKTVENEDLSNQNKQQSEKIAKAAALKISNVKVLGLKERSSGKLKETESANKVDAFRISFLIRENPITNPGMKKVHIIVQNEQGKTFGVKGNFYDENGEMIEYSDTTEVNYDNADIEVITVSNIKEGSLTKGVYTIKIFIENRYLGSTKITLK